MRYAKPPINKIIFPLVICFQICILAWMNAYGVWAENYVPDGHEEERKKIIEAVEKEFKNQRGSGVYTGNIGRGSSGAITNDFKTNQRQKGKKLNGDMKSQNDTGSSDFHSIKTSTITKSEKLLLYDKLGNAVIVSQKGQNLDIQVTKSTTGASVDTLKSGIIPKPVAKECDKDCKIRVLIENGIRKEIAETLVNECKNTAIDARNCIIVGGFIFANESSGGANCYKNNCSGMKAGGISYKSIEEGVKDWVSRYNKHWYNQKTPSSFYSSKPGVLPKTRYCLSEIQPDGTHLDYCKNGAKHAWAMFNLLNKQF